MDWISSGRRSGAGNTKLMEEGGGVGIRTLSLNANPQVLGAAMRRWIGKIKTAAMKMSGFVQNNKDCYNKYCIYTSNAII